MRINGRLEGVYTLMSPLSHIGESVGPDSFLQTQEIIGPDGRPTETFIYNGNALRGMFRDAGAEYFLSRLAGKDSFLQIPLDMFYLIFSGGAIGGKQKIDIDQARKIRQAIPIISIFGGGVGNQILPGKMNMNDGYPICDECQHFIPEAYRKPDLISWKQMTAERSFSRVDDAKNENLRSYLRDDSLMIAGADGQMKLTDGAKEQKKDKKKKKDKEDSPQQMRYTIEVLQAGSQLWNRIDIIDMSEIEFGALVSCIDQWAKKPYIGGQSRIGMGRVHVHYDWIPADGEKEDFIDVQDDAALSKKAQDAKALYDQYLDQYSGYLEEHKDKLVELIG